MGWLMPDPETDQSTAQDAFQTELQMLIDRFIDNWDLSVASAVGVLEMVKLDLYAQSREEEE